MTIHLRFDMLEEQEAIEEEEIVGGDTQTPEPQIPPIIVEVVEQVTLGRGEDEVLTLQFGDAQSDAEFNRQMALLKNPHVDLTPFYAHERGVSRKHCRIRIRNMRLTVVDLGSTNGTYVNNMKLEPNIEYPIKEGDELRMGFLTVTLKVIHSR